MLVKPSFMISSKKAEITKMPLSQGLCFWENMVGNV